MHTVAFAVSDGNAQARATRTRTLTVTTALSFGRCLLSVVMIVQLLMVVLITVHDHAIAVH